MNERMWLDLQKFAEDGAADSSMAAAASEPAEAAGTEIAEENTAASAQAAMSFRDIVRDPRYKDDYNTAVERAVKKRLAAQERKQRADMEPMLQALGRKYRLAADGLDMETVKQAVLADDSLLEEAAADAGMSVEGFRRVEEAESILRQNEAERREAENRQRWQQIVDEGERLKAKDSEFSLDSAMQDQRFRSMVATLQNSGMENPVEAAYYALNYNKLVQKAVEANTEMNRQQIANDIQSGMSRPNENGTARASATHRLDPRNLTKEQREEIRKRIGRGEKITFGPR